MTGRHRAPEPAEVTILATYVHTTRTPDGPDLCLELMGQSQHQKFPPDRITWSPIEPIRLFRAQPYQVILLRTTADPLPVLRAWEDQFGAENLTTRPGSAETHTNP